MASAEERALLLSTAQAPEQPSRLACRRCATSRSLLFLGTTLVGAALLFVACRSSVGGTLRKTAGRTRATELDGQAYYASQDGAGAGSGSWYGQQTSSLSDAYGSQTTDSTYGSYGEADASAGSGGSSTASSGDSNGAGDGWGNGGQGSGDGWGNGEQGGGDGWGNGQQSDGWGNGEQGSSAQGTGNAEDNAQGPQTYTFYMYRAQSENNYRMENVNAANLAGVLWYLHNEIVASTPRKYDVTRVMRLKVTVKNTEDYFRAKQRQFGPYVAFDQGKCTVPNCDNIWYQYGAVVGCQAINVNIANYKSEHKTTVTPSPEGTTRPPIWYSLPGPCPSQYVDYKTDDCIWQNPGGFCDSQSVVGNRSCTFWYEWAGQIHLDELVGIENYTDFLRAGYREYDAAYDTGYGATFWNGIHNETACQERMQKIKWLFYQKTGFAEDRFPLDIPDPLCDGP